MNTKATTVSDDFRRWSTCGWLAWIFTVGFMDLGFWPAVWRARDLAVLPRSGGCTPRMVMRTLSRSQND